MGTRQKRAIRRRQGEAAGGERRRKAARGKAGAGVKRRVPAGGRRDGRRQAI